MHFRVLDFEGKGKHHSKPVLLRSHVVLTKNDIAYLNFAEITTLVGQLGLGYALFLANFGSRIAFVCGCADEGDGLPCAWLDPSEFSLVAEQAVESLLAC